MPYENFIKRMQGAARQSAEKPVCRGYPVVDDDFKRKIIYPRCRKGVNAPSDFDVALADRSTLPPEAKLELEFVYGYDGVTSHAQNLFFVNGAGRPSAGREAASSKPKLGDVVAYRGLPGLCTTARAIPRGSSPATRRTSRRRRRRG